MPQVTQEQAIEMMMGTQHCFLTGAGGVGKSYTLKEVMYQHDEKLMSYILSGSTGIAAQLLGGRTVFSELGMGPLIKQDVYQELEDCFYDFYDQLCDDYNIDIEIEGHIKKFSKKCNLIYEPLIKDMEEIVRGTVAKNFFFKSKIASKLRQSYVLIIDEISMLGAVYFTAIDALCRVALGKDKPFGGLKLIVVGDPFQLPPVKDKMFMISPSYFMADFQILNLTKNYRATNDEWNLLLKKFRTGPFDDNDELLPEVYDFLVEACNRKAPEDITRLVATNKEAKIINDRKLADIPEQKYTYNFTFKDKYQILGKNGINNFFKDRLVKKSIDLKVGAYVMTVVNDTKEDMFVNGTCGHIEALFDDRIVMRSDEGTRIELARNYPFVTEKTIDNPNFGQLYINEVGREEVDDRRKITAQAVIYQLPIIHAWAITTHKSQGQTLERARIDLRRGFTDGQAYVALSRVKSQDGVFLDGFPSMDCLDVNLIADNFVRDFINDFTQPLSGGVFNTKRRKRKKDDEC